MISFFNFELLLKIGVVAVFRSLGGGSKMTGWEINPVGRGIKLTGRKNNPAGRNDNPEQVRNYPECQFRYHSGTPPAYQNTNRTLEVLIKLICNLNVKGELWWKNICRRSKKIYFCFYKGEIIK